MCYLKIASKRDSLNVHASLPLCVSIMFMTHLILSVCMCLCMCDACSAGNICMFISNEKLKASVDHSPQQLNKTIDNINTFVTAVPKVRD